MAGSTDKTIRKLVALSRAEGRRVEGGHPEADGLRVRAKADESGDGFAARWVWYGPRSEDGKRRMYDLGAFPAVSPKEAAAQLQSIRADLERRSRGLPSAAAVAENMTLRQLLARFAWSELRQRRQAREPLRALKRTLLDACGNIEARSLRSEDVIEVVERIKREHKHTQARKVFALIKQMCTFGTLPTVRAFDRSPVEGLTERVFRFRRPERRDRLTKDELAELWRVLHGKPRDPRAETSNLALLVLLATARRTGELVYARWTDVDLDAAIWRVPKENRKATRSLEDRMPDTDSVHLPPQAVKALRRLRALAPSSPWVLASQRDSESGHIGEQTLSRALRDMKLQGILHLDGHGATPHAFRHAFKATAHENARAWKVSGVALEVALGHVLPGIFGTYTLSDFDEERARALDRWCDYLDGIAGLTAAGVVNLDAARG
jgi:integrase